MPVNIDPGLALHPIARPLLIDAGDEGRGWAIAFGWSGTAMYYLISDPNQPAPIWVEDSQIQSNSAISST